MPRALVVALALLLAGCGGSDDEDARDVLPGTKAQETNLVGLDGIEYEVTLFRQLNPRLPADRAFYRRDPPPGPTGVYAAFLEACNVSDRPRRTTAALAVLDAFGEAFPRVEPRDANPIAYRPERLQPGDCLPAPGSVAARAADGAVAAFEIPFEATQDVPLVLELRDDDKRALIELDL